MIDREYVELFIKLRAEGCTYDEIVERTGISKPTLIRWGKVYKEQIKNVETRLMAKVAEAIVEENKDVIKTFASAFARSYQDDRNNEKNRSRMITRIYKKLDQIFHTRIKEIAVEMEGKDNLVKVTFRTD